MSATKKPNIMWRIKDTIYIKLNGGECKIALIDAGDVDRLVQRFGPRALKSLSRFGESGTV